MSFEFLPRLFPARRWDVNRHPSTVVSMILIIQSLSWLIHPSIYVKWVSLLVIIYRSSWEARKSIPFFSAVDCNNSSPSQSTKTLRSDFLFSFSLIDPSRRCCPSPPSIYLFLVRLSVFTDIFSHHFTSFVIYFWSFHIIRDVFSPIFTSYFSCCIASTVYLQFYLK